MRPQRQTEFGERGNCLAACVATVLDVDLAEVPNWNVDHAPHTHWYPAYKEWLAQRGIASFCADFGVAVKTAPFRGVEAPAFDTWLADMGLVGRDVITCGPGPRGYRHCTVYRDGVLVWDPHPDATGLLSVDEHYLLGPKAEIDEHYRVCVRKAA